MSGETSAADEVKNADAELVDIARKINGWDPTEGRSLSVNIQSMVTALFGVIQDRDARIQRLHLKLGQLVERGL